MNEIQQVPPAVLREAACFFDLDGTLAELRPRPEDVCIAPAVREALTRLRALNPAVAVVSGRPLTQIDALLAPLQLPAAGIHGAEWRLANGEVQRPVADEARLQALRQALEAGCARLPGLRLEDKGVAFALHFRGAEALEPQARELAEALAAHHPQFVLQPGKCVFELKPRGASKGEVIRRFMQQAPFAGRRPLFLGDDLTDEAGFAVVEELAGWAIKVGEGESRARARLASVAAVEQWLQDGVAEVAPAYLQEPTAGEQS